MSQPKCDKIISNMNEALQQPTPMSREALDTVALLDDILSGKIEGEGIDLLSDLDDDWPMAIYVRLLELMDVEDAEKIFAERAVAVEA